MAIDPCGKLAPALGAGVSLTALKGVDGLPFEGSFVAGAQIGPSGDLMPEPARLTMTLPGTYSLDQLFGFASDDSGAEFHLVPVQVVPMPGISGPSKTPPDSGLPGMTIPTMPPLPAELATLIPPTRDLTANSTNVYFETMHFSNFGVILSTIEAVAKRESHPPTSVADQVDDLLVPLQPSPYDVLRIEFRDVIQSQLDPIDNLEPSATCDYVAKTAQRYLAWESAMRRQKLESRFSKEMADSRAVLLSALKECLKTLCDVCLGPNGGAHEQMVVLTVLGDALGRDPSMALWELLTNRCASQAGFSPPFPPVTKCGEDCGTPGPTPALVCPK